MLSLTSLATCLLIPLSLAAPAGERRQSGPTVDLSYATVVGSTSLGVDSFLGIPYAQPPIDNLRLRPPQPITSNLGTIDATSTPTACPQFYFQGNTSSLPEDVLALVLDTPLFQDILTEGEDCLTVNVQRPSSATADSNLPVLFWIFGGGFELGSTQMYDASQFILNGVSQGKDFIYVSVNYRVGGFGFMPGAEILANGSANLGLLDQRLGLQWTADNIAAFGGDPSKVTIWGESAGAISVWDQMAMYDGDITYNGEPLFRGAIMDSGSIVPADPVDCPKGQAVYDTVVANAGCSGASDTLECLRGVEYTTLLNAANSVPGILSYTSVALSYLPRPDGVVLTASPEVLLENNLIAKVPFIVGDQEDEGTIFALEQSNLSTTADVVDYLSTVFFHDATVDQLEDLVATYPDDASDGSPFDTGDANEIYPQYKRLAAILGDLTFTLTRRAFLSYYSTLNPTIPSWSYLATYDFGTPILGTFHGSDILTTYGTELGFPCLSIQAYYLSFIYELNPNTGTSILLPDWPQWSDGQELLDFGALINTLTPDDFRSSSYDYIIDNVGSFHI